MSGPVPTDDQERGRTARRSPDALRAVVVAAAIAAPVSAALALAVVVQFGPVVGPPFVLATLGATVAGSALEAADRSGSGEGAALTPRQYLRWGFVVPVLVTAAFVLLVALGRRAAAAHAAVEYGSLVVASVTVTAVGTLRE